MLATLTACFSLADGETHTHIFIYIYVYVYIYIYIYIYIHALYTCPIKKTNSIKKTNGPT